MDFLWFLHDLRTPALDVIFQIITMLGDEIVLVGILCVMYWCVDKDKAYGAAISFFVSALLVQGLKIALRIDRPWILDPAFTPVAGAVAAATGFSFPSGHTQSAASIYGYLGLSTGKLKWALLSWGLVLLVGFSRMYLGVHTLNDVFGAMLLSLVVSIVVLRYMRSGRSDIGLLAVLTLLSAGILIFAFILHGKGTIDTHYLSDCCKAAGGCIGCAAGLFWARRAIPYSTKTPHVWQQIVKLLVGVAGLLAIKSGLKALLGETLLLDAIRYGLIGLWALAIYPMLFSKVFKPPQPASV